METVTFDSGGVGLEGWWLQPDVAALDGPAGAPCVVMAHGFGCTRDCGLLPFATRFAGLGAHVLVFDYRGFGGSAGAPRQDVDHRRHREDYHAAVAFARAHDGVDPDRVALWGTSYSGGHVIAVAATDHRIAAVVSQGAAVDGLAALTGRGKPPRPAPSRGAEGGHATGGAARARRLGAAVVRDLARAATRRPPVLVPFLGAPGSGALMSGAGAEEFTTITGPTFRNEMCARGLTRIAFNRPIRRAADVGCPTLLVIAEDDEIAPAASVHEMARLMPRAETVTFECRHFALYSGHVFTRSVAAQVEFLIRVLGVGSGARLATHPLWRPFGPPDETAIAAARVDGHVPAPARVEVVAPDPTWPDAFAGVRDRVVAALGERALAVEHVGSTAVPGLRAKPVIDVDVTVADSADEPAWLPDLEAAGFALRIREPDWEEHRLVHGTAPDANVHVFSAGAVEPRRHELFRDWLRTHEADRTAYGAVKTQLAAEGFTDGMLYNNAKAGFVYDLYERIFTDEAGIGGGAAHDPHPRP